MQSIIQLTVVKTITLYYRRQLKNEKVLNTHACGGSKTKWTAETYVKDQFDKAMKETMLRTEDKVVK